MNTITAARNPANTKAATPLVCGSRGRPPLGAAPAACSHRDLRDRLLRCAG